MFHVTIDPKTNEITIKGKLTEPTPSSTGKMFIVASTGGFTGAGVVLDGKPLKMNLTVGYSAGK